MKVQMATEAFTPIFFVLGSCPNTFAGMQVRLEHSIPLRFLSELLVQGLHVHIAWVKGGEGLKRESGTAEGKLIGGSGGRGGGGSVTCAFGQEPLRSRFWALSPSLRRQRYLNCTLDVCLPFRKHRARERISRNCFLRDCANYRNRLCERTLGELLSRRLRNLIVALCSFTVFVACFQESICAMVILSLRKISSEELFLAGLRKTRVIIARDDFWRFNCITILNRG